MWAQLITTRVKAGKESEIPRLFQQLRDAEQPGSGLVRTLAMRDQNDPAQLSILVVFESEEKARAREDDPRRADALEGRGPRWRVFDGPPSFTDLTVVEEFSP